MEAKHEVFTFIEVDVLYSAGRNGGKNETVRSQ
jgi:hypothetical protein